MKNNKALSILLSAALILSLAAPALSSSAHAEEAAPATTNTEQRVYHRYSETKYEAESAEVTGAEIATDHLGFSGTGFIANFDAVGDEIVFTISVPTTGDYTIYFRYANGTGHKAYGDIFLDGTKQESIPFHTTSGWDSWEDSEIGITGLSSGTHSVRLSFVDYAINIDYALLEERHESVRSFYLSNWTDMMAIWNDTTRCTAETPQYGPAIRELHYSANWAQNQLKDYSGFFRDETAGKAYTNATSFNGEAYFASSGGLYSNYLKYEGNYPDQINLSRDYFMLPNKNVLLTRYVVENIDTTPHTISILDMIHPNNESTANVSAQYSSELNAITFDMSTGGQYHIALGAFEAGLPYQVADDTQTSLSAADCSPWISFNNNGTLKGNGAVDKPDVSAAFEKTVTIPAGGSTEVFFYMALGSDTTELTNICNEIAAHDGAYWVNYMSGMYQNWFSNAKDVPDFLDDELETMYKHNLVMIKNSILPGTTTAAGAMPATTNAFDYAYKVWARDAATTMMAMDAAGFYTEGAQFWRWMAARQLSGEQAGTFYTCMNLWDNSHEQFIEPEHDSIGWFLYGVYRHCLETGDYSLADELWPQIKASADFIMNNIDTAGFGPKDFSIWEDMEHFGDYTYTQALYVAGLQAAAKLAQHKNLGDLATSYDGAASTIKTAINRDDTDGVGAGLWNPAGGYYNKLVLWDGSPDRLMDASAMILFALGVVDVNSSRAQSTIATFEENLSNDTYGMARYAYDVYYTDESPWSPSGDEALRVSPSWPQISFWNAIAHVYSGDSDTALQTLNWAKHRTGIGFMSTGECVSDISEKPVVSTASEPVTGAAFVLACLTYDGQIDMRIQPEVANAGAYKAVDIASTDMSKYDYIPYYTNSTSPAAISSLDMVRTYISNDDSNLYVCVGTKMPIAATGFRCALYCSDPALTAPSSDATLNGSVLHTPASYAFVYDNADEKIKKYTASAGSWQLVGEVSDSASRCDTASGTLELRIPLSNLGISSVGSSTWFYVSAYLDGTSGASQIDSSHMNLHYRTTASNQTWLYGDFDTTTSTDYNFGRGDTIYMVLTDRFYDGDPSNNGTLGVEYRPGELKYRQGGDWQGMIDKMNYIKDLGVTAIWISPVQLNVPLSKSGDEAGYHGYFTKDYYATDDHFGSLNKLKEMVALAHEKGMKVILDAVPNHTADFLEPFATEYTSEDNRPAAPFNNADWFHHNGDITDYDDYWQLVNCDMGGLDDLAQEIPAVTQELIEVYQYWISEVGFDAIRVDAASSMPKTFLKEFQDGLGMATFGEIFNGSVDFVSDFQNYEWGMLDFPLFFSARDVFANDANCSRLKEILDQDSKYFNPQNLVTFIDNHDRDRFLCVADDSYEKLRMALAFIFTVRGTPDVYYGTEQNLYGNGELLEPFGIANSYNREMMSSFDQNSTTYQYIQRLSEIRKLCPALSNGTQREMWCSDTVYSFSRRDDSTGQETIVVMNNGYTDTTITIPMRAETSYYAGAEFVNLLNTNQTVKIEEGGTTGRQFTISLPAKSCAILAHGAFAPYTMPTYAKTTIRVHYDTGMGNYISLRGDLYPLDWDEGVKMGNVSSEVWEFHIERYTSGETINFKPLLNDTTWSTGNNYTVTAGNTIDIYPNFS